MATKKKTAAKPVISVKASVSKSNKAIPTQKAAANKIVKKATVAKKANLPTAKAVKKTTLAKKSTPAKKAAPIILKKAAPAKKVATKNIKTVNKTTSKNTPPKKAAPVKAAPVSKKPVAPVKAAHVKKAATPVKAEPAKKAAPAKAVVPAPAAKKDTAQKAATAPKKATVPAKKIVKSTTSTSRLVSARAGVMGKQLPTVPRPTPTATPTVRNGRDDKKPAVVIAHRKIETRTTEDDASGKTMINYQPDYTRSILDQPTQQSGPVYRYSDEELNEFRELIGGRLDSARKEMLYLQGLITRKDEAGTEDTENRYMNMEDGSGAMEREQLAQLASRQIQFINHLEKALMRIENKTYGICRVTGKLIDKARLRAVPHATLSIEAKRMMGSNKQ